MVKALGHQKTGSNQFLDWFLVCTSFNLFYKVIFYNYESVTLLIFFLASKLAQEY